VLVFPIIIYKIFVTLCQHVLRHTRFEVCTAVIPSVNFSNMGYVRHLSSFPDPAIGSSLLDLSLRSRPCFCLPSAR